MSENLKWYQRKTEIFWAAVFGGVYLFGDKVFHKILEYYPTLIQEYPFLKIILFLLPWLPLFIVFYKYLKWRSKARSLETLNQQINSTLIGKEDELQQAQMNIESMMKWDGIELTTGLDKYIRKLEGSGHHPRDLLEKIRTHLDFMGHGASKWTKNKDRLSDMLTNIKFNNNTGKARFLVINPFQSGLEKERAAQIAESLRTLWELGKKHDNLEVKVYNHIPQLRLTFYDYNLVVVGHYQGKGRKDSSDTPLLVFYRECDWSFYKAFLEHFEAEWARAVDITKLKISEIDTLTRGSEV